MVLAADPWTDILTFLQTVIVPNWGELINMLPFFFLIGVVGPIITLIILLQGWYFLHRRRGHVHRVEPQPVPATRDAAGLPVFPPNVPFCEVHELPVPVWSSIDLFAVAVALTTHALLFPPKDTACTVDGAELTVKCPVDGTSRTASDRLCRSCGTEYRLGATESALTIRQAGQPPAGGAAVA